ncbi:MAG: ribose 5-phosphate isomerase B [Candidatus Omnitrophica bacterium]|nr:ribose 5-phosphate isomerase B [Candidatus Omnitrophota bacterium]
MKIAIASDHRGFKLKIFLEKFLKEKGYEVIDFGTHSPEPCDYPDYVYPAAQAVKNKKVDRAVVICYTGIGSCIVANKLKGIRAALVTDLATATLSRRHNDSNVLVLSARNSSLEKTKKIILRWLRTGFEGGRHLRRLKKISLIEEKERYV